MHMKRRILATCFCGIMLLLCSWCTAAYQWHKLEGKHFIVYYTLAQDRGAAQKALRAAEQYYGKIADQIGYARYANFWTWNERVKIIIFPDRQSFAAHTNQPPWSRGLADRYSDLFQSRVIITYRQEHNFLDGLLPHEISHLVLWDFVGFDTPLPAWFEEGVAQLNEAGRTAEARQQMRPLALGGKHMPFDVFMAYDIRRENDIHNVAVFYSQSVSVVDFMMREFGSAAFAHFCRLLREGRNFEDALKAAYHPGLQSIFDLERRWISHITR